MGGGGGRERGKESSIPFAVPTLSPHPSPHGLSLPQPSHAPPQRPRPPSPPTTTTGGSRFHVPASRPAPSKDTGDSHSGSISNRTLALARSRNAVLQPHPRPQTSATDKTSPLISFSSSASNFICLDFGFNLTLDLDLSFNLTIDLSYNLTLHVDRSYNLTLSLNYSLILDLDFSYNLTLDLSYNLTLGLDLSSLSTQTASVTCYLDLLLEDIPPLLQPLKNGSSSTSNLSCIFLFFIFNLSYIFFSNSSIIHFKLDLNGYYNVTCRLLSSCCHHHTVPGTKH